MKKIITLLLAMLMLLSCLALSACKEDKKPPVSTEEDTLESTEIPSESISHLNGLNYGNDTFTILGYESVVPEFGNAETSQDLVEQTLIERDAYVQELLGIEFLYQTKPCTFAERNTYSDMVRQSVQTGAKAWDLIGTYSMVPPNLALNNVLVDMRGLDYVDFTKAWYPKYMADACTINNQTYFITGDISSVMLYRMQGVFFSAKKAEQYDIDEEELYQMVYDNEWTIEKMFTMCEELGAELGGDGSWDAKDFYPIITSGDAWIDSFYFATGLTMLSETADGKIEASKDPISEKTLSIYATVFDAKNTYRSYYAQSDEKVLLEGNCIFSISPIINFRQEYAESNELFRILPFPKYDERDDYKTWLGFAHTQYCIPNDVADPNRSAAVMEALGYYGYNYVTPVIFEETMKLRYSESGDVSKMFDIMRSGCTYDVSALFYMAFAGVSTDASSMFRNAVINDVTNWMSMYRDTYENGLKIVAEKINSFYSKQ